MEACYFSTWGPPDGPIRHRDSGGIALGAVPEAGASWPIIGKAHPFTWEPDGRGPIAVSRLRIRTEWLDGRFLCHRRRFVPLATDLAEHTA
jgi:hypothetical protein